MEDRVFGHCNHMSTPSPYLQAVSESEAHSNSAGIETARPRPQLHCPARAEPRRYPQACWGVGGPVELDALRLVAAAVRAWAAG